MHDNNIIIIMHIFHRLRYLNLDNNEIYTIPHLKLLGMSPLKPAKSKEQNLMAHTSSSSLDGTPALIHSSSSLPVSREEGSQIDGAKESSRVGTREEDWVVAVDARADATTKPTEQGEESNDPRTMKSEPSLVAHLKMENASEEKNSSTSEQVIPSDVTVSEKTLLHSEVSQVKSEPSLVLQSAKTDSKIEAEDTSGDIKEKNAEEYCSGHTISNASPPPQADTTPPAQIDQSAHTSPKDDMGEEGGVGNLQLISGGDENSKELAPFPQLETLSLINNLVSKSLR